MHTPEITSVKGLIDKLGGTLNAQRKLGAKHPSVVSMWIKRESIASNLYGAHQEILASEGLVASPALWGQVSPQKETAV